MDELWTTVLRRVSQRIGAKSYRDWFEPTRLLSTSGTAASDASTEILLEVPNSLFKEWMDRNYKTVVEEAMQEVGARTDNSALPTKVRFVLPGEVTPDAPAKNVNESRNPEPTGRKQVQVGLFDRQATTPSTEPANPKFDQRYTFDDFVVGSCNEFAHAAARAVADNPGKSYNPLYLYGGVGLGKTHLMQAIGHALTSPRAGRTLKLAYVSAERFMCEMINAIRWKRTPEFRDRYRNIDVLLVDDIQFLEGKEATQEEFFHTFRSLYEDGKQIVLSSDCPPRELATLEERLRSRFESGLIADLQAPDLETKLAILRRKAESEGVFLPDELALYVANKVRSNVREMEGCLNRILALASLRGAAPTLDIAREATRGIFPDDEKPVTIESIQRFVADYYNLKITELKARTNARVIAFPRQVAMYLCKKMTNSSFPDIGKKFGGKHHSTVIHSVNKISSEAAKSEEFNNLLSRFMEQIH